MGRVRAQVARGGIMQKKRLSLKIRLLILMLALAIVPISGYSAWVFMGADDYLQLVTLDRLGGLSKAKADAIDQFVKDRVEEIKRISAFPTIVSGLTLLVPRESEAPEGEGEVQTDVTQSSQEAYTSLQASLKLMLWDQKKYEELLIIDPDGNVIISTFDEHKGKSARETEYFTNGLKTTYIQDGFISPITGQLTMVVATPILAEDQSVRGVLAARLNLNTFFRLIQDETGLGQTGETVVVKKIISSIVFMAPSRHDVEAALTRKIELGAEYGISLQNAARGQSGSGLLVDYRGIPCFTSWQHIPSLDWGLVVKIEQTEALKPLFEIRMRMVWAAGIVIIFALICAMFVSNMLILPIRELTVAADSISKGDLNVKIMIRPGDEIGDLAESFERMVTAIKFFKKGNEPE
jgi:two-component system, NtrC family, sensor kinase